MAYFASDMAYCESQMALGSNISKILETESG